MAHIKPHPLDHTLSANPLYLVREDGPYVLTTIKGVGPKGDCHVDKFRDMTVESHDLEGGGRGRRGQGKEGAGGGGGRGRRGQGEEGAGGGGGRGRRGQGEEGAGGGGGRGRRGQGKKGAGEEGGRGRRGQGEE